MIESLVLRPRDSGESAACPRCDPDQASVRAVALVRGKSRCESIMAALESVDSQILAILHFVGDEAEAYTQSMPYVTC